MTTTHKTALEELSPPTQFLVLVAATFIVGLGIALTISVPVAAIVFIFWVAGCVG